jgi:hypothetical protein
MVKPAPPRPEPHNLNVVCASVLVTWIPRFAAAILLITGCRIATGYYQIYLGVMPDAVQKLLLDYSLTIFAGGAIFLLLYESSMREIVHRLFNVKSVEPIRGRK